MASFAKIDSNNKVVQVVKVNNAVIEVDGVEDEATGVAFLENLFGVQSGYTWKQCSYTGAIRKNYPGKGWTYDSERDAFLYEQPYSSWTLNETTCNWEPPVPYPDDGNSYNWNEETLQWEQLPNT